MWDVKHTHPASHAKYTGVSNEKILKNLALINGLNAKIRLRCILVRGVNTSAEHYSRIAELALGINNFDGVELIPYHAYGGTKATFIGRADNGRLERIPTSEQLSEARKALALRSIELF